MSRIVEEALREAEREATQLLEEANKQLEETIREIIRELSPQVVLARGTKIVSEVLDKARPPPPDKVVEEFIEQAMPSPDELAKSLPRSIPTPGELARAVLKMTDPTERIKLVSEAALPVAIILASILIALTVLIVMMFLR